MTGSCVKPVSSETLSQLDLAKMRKVLAVLILRVGFDALIGRRHAAIRCA